MRRSIFEVLSLTATYGATEFSYFSADLYDPDYRIKSFVKQDSLYSWHCLSCLASVLYDVRQLYLLKGIRLWDWDSQQGALFMATVTGHHWFLLLYGLTLAGISTTKCRPSTCLGK